MNELNTKLNIRHFFPTIQHTLFDIYNFYQHSRAPDSLFKLGEIYRIEGDIERSLGFYDKVNVDFPDSGASQLSKKSQEILKEESNLLE